MGRGSRVHNGVPQSGCPGVCQGLAPVSCGWRERRTPALERLGLRCSVRVSCVPTSSPASLRVRGVPPSLFGFQEREVPRELGRRFSLVSPRHLLRDAIRVRQGHEVRGGQAGRVRGRGPSWAHWSARAGAAAGTRTVVSPWHAQVCRW